MIFKQRLGELHQLADLQTERCHENTQVTDHDIVVGEHELLVHLLDVVLHDVEHAHLGEVQRLGKLVFGLIIVSITKGSQFKGRPSPSSSGWVCLRSHLHHPHLLDLLVRHLPLALLLPLLAIIVKFATLG